MKNEMIVLDILILIISIYLLVDNIIHYKERLFHKIMTYCFTGCIALQFFGFGIDVATHMSIENAKEQNIIIKEKEVEGEVYYRVGDQWVDRYWRGEKK